MQPLIKDGAYCVFRFGVEGPRGGRIVLAQHNDINDPETGGSYTVKKYQSTKVVSQEHEWTHSSIRLLPLNPDYSPIDIKPESAEDIKVIAEFAALL